MVDGATSTGLHVITNIEKGAMSMWYTRSRVSCELWFAGVAGDFIEQLRVPTGGREDGGVQGGWKQSLMGEVTVVEEESVVYLVGKVLGALVGFTTLVGWGCHEHVFTFTASLHSALSWRHRAERMGQHGWSIFRARMAARGGLKEKDMKCQVQ